MTERELVTSDGVRLAYTDLGDPDQPALVLLHALGEQRGTWTAITPALLAHFRVLAFDLRGHGDSDWPGTYSFRLMCEDVVDALDQLAFEDVTLLGHSMGGVVAYLTALRRPGTVRRLVVEDAPPPYERDRPIPVRDEEAHGFDWPVVPAIVGEVNAGDPELWASLQSIAAPTLLIAGGPSSHIPQDKLVEVAARIPDCRLVTIDAGHHVHSTEPELFVQTILEWWSALRSRHGVPARDS